MGPFRASHSTAVREPLPPGAVKQAFGTTFLVYLGTATVFTIVNLIGGTSLWMIAKIAVPMLIGDALLDIPLVLLTLRAGQAGWRGRWPGVVLLGVAVAMLQAIYDTEVRIAVGAIGRAHMVEFITRSLSVDTYDTGLLVALIAFQAAYNREVAQQKVLAAMGERERRASLAALRLQLNPHFLFNTMNALSSLVVVRRNEDAEAMIAQLSDFLRHVLATDPAGLEPLDQEFALTEAYLAIEQVRFGERLAVAVDLPAALARQPVPPFLLQPLVENAIKYAVTPARGVVTVSVSASVEGTMLRLEVRDDGATGEIAGGMGVGLANVRERLALHYGAAASLECGRLAGGYRATIRLPLAARPAEGASPA